MASIHVGTNQENPMQNDSCDFLFAGNVGVPLMATLSLPGFTLGLLVWLLSTLNILNDPDASQASTLYQGNQKNVSPSPVETSTPPSTSSNEISNTSNLQSKRIKRRKNKKNTRK